MSKREERIDREWDRGRRGLKVKVRGEGLRVRCAVCGGVVSSSGRECLRRLVAHEMVRKRRTGPHMEGHTIWTSVLLEKGDERGEITEVNPRATGQILQLSGTAG